MNSVALQPIGIMKSVFHFKNGTPRQSSLCDGARGVITIDKSIFNNPEHSLEGLEQFSHAWVIFVFHKNNNTCTKAKVKPPRLNGQRVGVFSTRSPYRPSNIGLSLVKIDKVEGASVYVSGIDILDGSPVLDIKPYIPEYDKPREAPPIGHSDSLGCHMTTDASNPVVAVRNTSVASSLSEYNSHAIISSGETAQTKEVLSSDSSSADHEDDTAEVNERCDILEGCEGRSDVLSQAVSIRDTDHLYQVSTDLGSSCVLMKKEKDTKASNEKLCNKLEVQTEVASWLQNPPVAKLDVTFTSQAMDQLQKFSQQTSDCRYKFEMFSTPEEAEKSIADILREEPRSVYRRQHCQDSLYYFAVDVLHVTCWFDGNTAQVVRIKPVASVPMLQPHT